MKINQLQINIEQLAIQVELTMQTTTDEDIMCRLLDAKEYLCRAWWAIEGTHRKDIQTTLEMEAAMRKD